MTAGWRSRRGRHRQDHPHPGGPRGIRPRAFEGGGFATLAWMPYLALSRAVGRPIAGDASHAAAAVEREVGPGILFVDDLQWVDPASRDALERLAGRVMVVAAVREGDPDAAEAMALMDRAGCRDDPARVPRRRPGRGHRAADAARREPDGRCRRGQPGRRKPAAPRGDRPDRRVERRPRANARSTPWPAVGRGSRRPRPPRDREPALAARRRRGHRGADPRRARHVDPGIASRSGMRCWQSRSGPASTRPSGAPHTERRRTSSRTRRNAPAISWTGGAATRRRGSPWGRCTEHGTCGPGRRSRSCSPKPPAIPRICSRRRGAWPRSRRTRSSLRSSGTCPTTVPVR